MIHEKASCGQLGMTLVELLITVSVMVVVLMMGVPSFQGLMARTKMANAANTLLGHLQFARSEAVKRSTNVTVCPSADGATCLADAAALWSGGYILRVDSASPPVLRVVGELEMQGIAVKKNGSSPRVVFQADGSASGYSSAFTICDMANLANKRAVIVSNVGRVRVSDYASGGGALDCD